jgi:hypothetical protein
VMLKILPLFILIVSLEAGAQEALKPRPSPMAVIAMKYKDCYVKVVYSQPQKRGREIFGGIVPFGEVWRTGANEATEITITKDILFNSTLIKAGTYSLFTIPDRVKWTIILNSETGLWGSYNYNSRLDVVRFDVPVQNLDTPYEPFTMMFEQVNDKASLILMWDKTKVAIPIKFTNL